MSIEKRTVVTVECDLSDAAVTGVTGSVLGSDVTLRIVLNRNGVIDAMIEDLHSGKHVCLDEDMLRRLTDVIPMALEIANLARNDRNCEK